MKRNRALSFLIITTTLLLLLLLVISTVESAENTVVRLEMKHRDTIFHPSSPFRHIEDVMGADKNRHVMITQKRQSKGGGGVKMRLGSGIDYGAAQYFTEIMVGTPAKKFRVLVDTGSELTWINCRLRDKGSGKIGKRRVFRAGESSTFRKIGCLTQTCKSDLTNLFSLAECPTPGTPCSYDYRYADGSTAQGVFGKETFMVGQPNGRIATLPRVLMGCTSSFTGTSFRGADGVLGLAFSDYSFTTKATNALGSKFGYCLVDHLSTKNISNYITFGSVSSYANKTAAERTTPLDLNLIPPFYAVNVIGISLGDKMLDIPTKVWNGKSGGGTILDSGTSLTLLADVAYKIVVSAFERHLVNFKRVKPEGVPIEYCFDTATGFDENKLPQLTFHFKGGTRFEPHRRSYIIDTADGVKCLGFVAAGSPATNVIGNIMQQNYLWEFNLMASTLSFAPSTCL